MFTAQTKSLDRVRDLGEVYTNKREVNAMLDLIPAQDFQIETRFLEPTCGHGNFLVAIFQRKLNIITSISNEKIFFEYMSLKALSSIYGMDICQENIVDSKKRLTALLRKTYKDCINKRASNGYKKALDTILDSNIQCGDMLNGTHALNMVEYQWHDETYMVERKVFTLDSLIQNPSNVLLSMLPPQPIKSLEAVHFLQLNPLNEPPTALELARV
jgi:hypothetical protein